MNTENTETDLDETQRNAVPVYTVGIGTRITDIAGMVGGKKRLAELSGLSESQLHRIVAGESQAKVEPIAAMAHAAGVSVGWLMTGEGPMLIKDLEAAQEAKSPVDMEMLEGILTGLAEIEEREGEPMDPNWRARMTAALYEYFTEEEAEAAAIKRDVGKVIKLIRKAG